MRKKSFKGMTLMEVIIAMVIMVIAASMLVEAAVVVINNTRTARHVITKVDEQAPVIENRPSAVTAYDTAAVIQVQLGAGAPVNIAVNKFEAPTTQAPEDQRAGNMKYFEYRPVTTTS